MKHIFIINTIAAGAEFGIKLRQHLEKRGDVDFFVFNTSRAGMETEIAEKMIKFFEGQKFRFYCCGGSGTMRNIMQGTKDYKDVEFAFYPLGKTNDFLKVFEDNIDAFKNIDNLIDGHVESIDYIKTNYGYALNSVSFGLDSLLSERLNEYSAYDILGKRVPFLLAYIDAILNARPNRVVYKINDEIKEGKVTEMIVANGRVFGGQLHITDDADIRDGILDYVLSLNEYGGGVMKAIKHMIKNDIEELRKITDNGKCDKFVIRSANERNLALNLDGEVIRGGKMWTIEVVHKGMRFVIPKGITL